MITVTTQIHVQRLENGKKRFAPRPRPSETVPPGLVPRISRLMALAINFERALRKGVVPDFSELAQLYQVTPSRISQIMNLTLLAPDIQEAILFLPNVATARSRGLHILQVQHLAMIVEWESQRVEWRRLVSDSAHPQTA